MRDTSYELRAAKQTVSVTLNSDLYAQARSFEINTSRVAEEALAYAVGRKIAEQTRREVEVDVAFCNAWAERHRAALDAIDAWSGSLEREPGGPA